MSDNTQLNVTFRAEDVDVTKFIIMNELSEIKASSNKHNSLLISDKSKVMYNEIEHF